MGATHCAMLEAIELRREYMTTPEASRRSGYLATLVRRQTLEGFRLVREWFNYTDSLE